MPEDLTRIAEMDQAVAGLRTTSQFMWEYFTLLREAGFGEKQAFALLRDRHKIFWASIHGDTKKK